MPLPDEQESLRAENAQLRAENADLHALVGQLQEQLAAAVQRITHNGQSRVAQMDADLVGAAGQRKTVHDAVAFVFCRWCWWWSGENVRWVGWA